VNRPSRRGGHLHPGSQLGVRTWRQGVVGPQSKGRPADDRAAQIDSDQPQPCETRSADRVLPKHRLRDPSRFTIVNIDRTDTKVALGRTDGDLHKVEEFSAGEQPAFYLAQDLHDPAGRDGGNSRNGTRGKTVLTEAGPVEITVPRDRDGSFEPRIVRKR
jgi:hypothetical protein